MPVADSSSFRMIRPATKEDAAAVARLWTEAYVLDRRGGRSEPYTEADLAAAALDGTIFVAEDGGQLAGAVVLYPPDVAGRDVARTGEAEISRLAVTAGARRRGLGRALVATCCAKATKLGWNNLVIWSRAGQFEAHRLYESIGFKRVPSRDTLDHAGNQRLVFECDLEVAGVELVKD